MEIHSRFKIQYPMKNQIGKFNCCAILQYIDYQYHTIPLPADSGSKWEKKSKIENPGSSPQLHYQVDCQCDDHRIEDE